jgi:hypothetical protein
LLKSLISWQVQEERKCHGASQGGDSWDVWVGNIFEEPVPVLADEDETK